jgi:hypothetical protein
VHGARIILERSESVRKKISGKLPYKPEASYRVLRQSREAAQALLDTQLV